MRSMLAGLALLAAVPAAAAEFAFATLEGGLHVGFALVHPGQEIRTGGIGEVVVQRTNGVSRVLFDEDAGTYFGYRLEAEALAIPGRLRVVLRPLSPRIADDLRRRTGCLGCPLPKPLASGPERPAPRVISDGDFLTFDLLVNPQTGGTILDAVKVSSQPISVDDMKLVAHRVVAAQEEMRRADLLAARGSLSSASMALVRVLALTPSDPVAHNKLGICYQRSGRTNEAWAQYERALEIDPDYAAVWNNMGSIEHNRRHFVEALKLYERAISLKPDFATGYKNLGAAYLAQGQLDEGLAAYRAAHRLDPSILSAPAGSSVNATGVEVGLQYYYFAKIYAAASDLESALTFLQRAFAAGFYDLEAVAEDTDLSQLLADPRYLALVEEFAPRPE